MRRSATFQFMNARSKRNSFFVLVGDGQAVCLNEEFRVKADTEVGFVKFTPLVGG